MDLNRFHGLVERLRKQAIGAPKMIAEKEAFEYEEQSIKVVAVLKLIRATQGVFSIKLLCEAGLFVDAGAIIRCVNDCVEEVYFLLESYPTASANVDKFVKRFFEQTIDGYLKAETPPVPHDKIANAVVRVLKDGQDEATRKLVVRIYETFCTYVHAGYSNIMEVYNGNTDSFNLTGVPSNAQRQKWMPYVEAMANSVLLASAFLAHKLEMNEIHSELMSALE